jgi:hypothetical protein
MSILCIVLNYKSEIYYNRIEKSNESEVEGEDGRNQGTVQREPIPWDHTYAVEEAHINPAGWRLKLNNHRCGG